MRPPASHPCPPSLPPTPALDLPTQIKMEHITELGKIGRDCVATDQLPLSRVCHCVTATLATLASHPGALAYLPKCLHL